MCWRFSDSRFDRACCTFMTCLALTREALSIECRQGTMTTNRRRSTQPLAAGSAPACRASRTPQPVTSAWQRRGGGWALRAGGPAPAPDLARGRRRSSTRLIRASLGTGGPRPGSAGSVAARAVAGWAAEPRRGGPRRAADRSTTGAAAGARRQGCSIRFFC